MPDTVPGDALSDADVDQVLAALLPDGAWDHIVERLRRSIGECRRDGFKPATTAAVLRDSMATAVRRAALSDHEAELIYSLVDRALARLARPDTEEVIL